LPCEGTIALGMGIDFRKGLGRSKPWSNCRGSGLRKESVEAGSIISQKKTREIATRSQRIQICKKQHGWIWHSMGLIVN